MDQKEIERLERLMTERDHSYLFSGDAKRLTLHGLADAVPNLLAEVRRLELQVHELQTENVKLRNALKGFVDEECHCEESTVTCVQCEGRAALEFTEKRTATNMETSCGAPKYTEKQK
jgi:hypothetical protein